MISARRSSHFFRKTLDFFRNGDTLLRKTSELALEQLGFLKGNLRYPEYQKTTDLHRKS